MHELSIAEGIVRTALAVAAENHAVRVEEVHVRLGAMRLVVPEALELAWTAVTEGTPAEGAALKTEEVPIRARCRDCGRKFDPQVGEFA